MAVFARLMEFLFFFGLLGSLFVVLLSAVDDGRQLFDEENEQS